MATDHDHASGWHIRVATAADREAVAETLLAAGLAAWSGFLGHDRIEAANRGRVHPADLVAEDEQGVFAFVSWDEATGEITRLYTHPAAKAGAPAAPCSSALLKPFAPPAAPKPG